MIKATVDRVYLSNRCSGRAIGPSTVVHTARHQQTFRWVNHPYLQKRITTDNALVDILLAVPPVQVLQYLKFAKI